MDAMPLRKNVWRLDFWQCRLCWALGLAVIAHIAVLYSINFKAANDAPSYPHDKALEITVFRAPAARVDANQSQPSVVIKAPPRKVVKKQTHQAVAIDTPKAVSSKVITAEKKPNPAGSSTPAVEITPTPSQHPLNPALLAQQVADLGNSYLQQRIEKSREKRIVYVNNTNKDRYEAVEYERAVWEKAQRIAKLNWPDAARGRDLSGRLRLAVGINQDGSIYSVQIRQSSGERVLDDAAVHIIRLAAPFAPLPVALSQQVDVLVITGVWDWQLLNDTGLH